MHKLLEITEKHISALLVVRVMYAVNGFGEFSGCCHAANPWKNRDDS